MQDTVININSSRRRSEYTCLTPDFYYLQRKRSTAWKSLASVFAMAVVVCIIFLVFVISPVKSNPIPSTNDFKSARTQLIDSELCLRLGAGVVLNDREKILNQFIVKEKRRIMDDSRVNRTDYTPADSFYLSKPIMEATDLFKIIKTMPKGAALHLHDLAIASLDWVINNATYRENVYMCTGQDNFIQLSVFLNPPPNPGCEWKRVSTERAATGNNSAFDLSLKRNISLLASDPLQDFPSVTSAWDRFNIYFTQVSSVLFYEPIMRDYFRQALAEFRADNVQYIELRGSMYGLYDLNGTFFDAEHGVKMYKEVTEQFVRDFPDFSGAKVIMSSLRFKNTTDIGAEVKTAMDLYAKFPNFFLGYDLVGQEDPNHPLLYYIDELLYPSQQNPPVQLPFFFHAAETNWQGTDVDYNLVDALLLNTTRIGHGYGLAKHPKLIEIVKAKNVAVEVNPISNQVLGLVKDLRNHAMAPLIAQNIPLVISSDDPGTWDALPLSHDFYVAFMDMTGEDADLTVLKQLAMNSLQYSVMNSIEKSNALKLWQTKWDKFVNDTINTWDLVADPNIVTTEYKCPAPTTMATPVTTMATPVTTKGNSAVTFSGPYVIMVIPLYVILSYTSNFF